MTEIPVNTDPAPIDTTVDEQVDALTALRNELTQLKQAFDTELQSHKDSITQLQQENTALQRSLIREALTTPTPAPEPKTEQELYEERISELATKTLAYMEQ